MCCLGYEYEEADRKWEKQGKETVREEGPSAGTEKRPSCSCPKRVCAAEEKSTTGAPPGGGGKGESRRGKQERVQRGSTGEARSENRQDKGKTRGKPFSKRRTFWKKKKKKDS